MSKSNEEYYDNMAERLRSMLNDKLGEGASLKRNRDARAIAYLFGITHAHDLDGLDYAELAVIAGRAGLSGQSYSNVLRDGRSLAQYVEVKEGSQFEEEVREFMREVRLALDLPMP